MRKAETQPLMLFSQNKNKRHFIDRLFRHNFSVALRQNSFRIIASNHAQRVFQIQRWHRLYAKDIIAVKNCFKIFLLQMWLLKLVDIFIVGVLFGKVVLLDAFKGVQNVTSSVDWPLL